MWENTWRYQTCDNWKRKNYLLAEPKYHTTNFFSENSLATEIKKTEIYMNKPVYLRMSILELNEMLMFEFWYDYVKPKYGEKAKLCCMGTDSFCCIHKNRWYLKRHCRSCWHKIWHLKLWIEQTTTKRKEQESYWCFERWISWKNHEKTCWIESKNL